MEMGNIVSWEKKEGDKLNEGDLLAEIETDKATMGFETPEEGYLAKILIAAGSKGVPIGKLVCIIVENEADIAAFKDFKDDSFAGSAPSSSLQSDIPPPPSPSPPSSPQPPAAPVSAAPSSSPPAAGGRVYASPMAKKLAEQHNIRLQGKGSGLFGSITSADLDKSSAASTAPVSAPVQVQIPAGAVYVDIPVTNIRSVIAKRLLESKQNIPHYYVSVNANIDKILSLRKNYNKKLEKQGIKLSVNDFILKATALASVKVPEANSAWMNNVIRQYELFHILN